MTVLSLALSLFLVTNPIGNSPAVMALLRGVKYERQRFVLLRETFIAAVIAIAFLFSGEAFLATLAIRDYTVSICGGVLTLLVAISMIFPKHSAEDQNIDGHREPFVVPIATPLLAGGGLLTMIMVYAQREANNFKVFLALLISFSAVASIFSVAPYLSRILGQRGLLALEQLMGMVLCLISMELFVQGGHAFLFSLNTG